MRRKFNWSSKLLRQNKRTDKQSSPELSRLQKNIYRQAGLAGLTIVLTLVILFAMTSAWYTNIVQTSGLVFEAEPWGFDGTITVNEAPILAAPGDDGLISLTVENDSESISALSVNVSKAGMEPEMKKRLFFYVDTHMTRDGETMDRVYLNEYEGYTYTVFGKGQLTLTEQMSNAPQIKWEWVYDVLGYYVMANPIKDGTGNIISMGIQDYLRPIEYDYDEATTVFSTDADGNQVVEIKTVDGKTSPQQFLAELALKDGYGDQFGVSNLVYSDADKAYFYKIDVDEDDNGVYAYLCDYSDVQYHTQWDTDLGELAYQYKKDPNSLTAEQTASLRHVVTLNISAQRSESSVVNVSTLSSLNKAIAEGYADVIRLSGDITLSETSPLVIPANTRAMIDLNEKTITGTNTTGAIIYAQQGSSLTLMNGSIVGPGTNTGAVRGIETVGSEVIMSNIKMSGFDQGVYMGDQNTVDGKANELDSRVHMVGCTIDANWYGVYINGNGTNSAQKTQLIIDNSIVRGDGYGITGNGTSTGTGRWGTDIQIINGSLVEQSSTREGAGIYQPQKDSTLTISDSAVKGYTAIAMKGGSANIINSTVTGFGTSSIDPATVTSNSGFADTADAVYIDTGYGYEIRLDISGNSVLTSSAGKSLRVYKSGDENVFVQIVSGTFDQWQPDAYIAATSEQKTENGKSVITETTN